MNRNRGSPTAGSGNHRSLRGPQKPLPPKDGSDERQTGDLVTSLVLATVEPKDIVEALRKAKEAGRGLVERAKGSRAAHFLRDRIPLPQGKPPRDDVGKERRNMPTHSMSEEDYQRQKRAYVALCSGNRAARELDELERQAQQLRHDIQRAQRDLLEVARANNAARAKVGKRKQPGLSREEALTMAKRVRGLDEVTGLAVEISDDARNVIVRTGEIMIEAEGEEHNAGRYEIVIHDDGKNGIAEIFRLGNDSKRRREQDGTVRALPLHESLVKGLPEIVAAHRYDQAVINCLNWTKKHLQQRLEANLARRRKRAERQARKEEG